MEFIAKFAYAGVDGEVMMAGLADEEFDTKDYVLFRRSCRPGAADVALGHDRVHTTVGPHEGSAYGAIRSIELFGNHLKLEIGMEVVQALGAGPGLVVRFDPNLESIDEVAEMLRLIAGDLFVDRR